MARKKIKLEKGQYLYHENEVSNGVFCLKAGQVKIWKAESGRPARLMGIARPGDLVGISSLSHTNDRYTHSAQAFLPAEGCFIAKNELLSALYHNAETAVNLVLLLTGKLAERDQEKI